MTYKPEITVGIKPVPLGALLEKDFTEESKRLVAVYESAPAMVLDLIHARKGIREAVELIKKLPEYTGGDRTSEDLAVMTLVEQINRINRTLEKTGMPNNTDAAIVKAADLSPTPSSNL